MSVRVCECGRLLPDDDDRDDCFRCRVSGVAFTFAGGGGYGRKSFHGQTTAEFDRQIRQGAKDLGVEIDRA